MQEREGCNEITAIWMGRLSESKAASTWRCQLHPLECQSAGSH